MRGSAKRLFCGRRLYLLAAMISLFAAFQEAAVLHALPPDVQPPRVAALRFANENDNDELDPLETGLPYLLSVDLAEIPEFDVISPSMIAAVAAERGLENSSHLEPREAALLGRLLSADYVVTGRFKSDGNDIVLHLRIIRCNAEDVGHTKEIRYARESLYHLQGMLFSEVAMFVIKDRNLSVAFKMWDVRAHTRSFTAAMYFFLGVESERECLFEAAMKACQDAIAQDADFADARYYLGLCHFRMGNTDKALETWEDLLSRCPSHPYVESAKAGIADCLIEKGIEEYREKRFEEAENFFERATEFTGKPRSAVPPQDSGIRRTAKPHLLTQKRASLALLWLARTWFEMGLHEASMEAFESLSLAPPPRPYADDALAALARAYEKLGIYSEADRHYARVLRSFPAYRLHNGNWFRVRDNDMTTPARMGLQRVHAGLLRFNRGADGESVHVRLPEGARVCSATLVLSDLHLSRVAQKCEGPANRIITLERASGVAQQFRPSGECLTAVDLGFTEVASAFRIRLVRDANGRPGNVILSEWDESTNRAYKFGEWSHYEFLPPVSLPAGQDCWISLVPYSPARRSAGYYDESCRAVQCFVLRYVESGSSDAYPDGKLIKIENDKPVNLKSHSDASFRVYVAIERARLNILVGQQEHLLMETETQTGAECRIDGLVPLMNQAIEQGQVRKHEGHVIIPLRITTEAEGSLRVKEFTVEFESRGERQELEIFRSDKYEYEDPSFRDEQGRRDDPLREFLPVQPGAQMPTVPLPGNRVWFGNLETVNVIVPDALDGCTVWLGVFGGLIRIDRYGREVECFPVEIGHGLQDVICVALDVTDRNHIWVVAAHRSGWNWPSPLVKQSRVLQFDRGNRKFDDVSALLGLADKRPTVVLPGEAGEPLWVGTTEGLYECWRDSGEIRKIEVVEGCIGFLVRDGVRRDLLWGISHERYWPRSDQEGKIFAYDIVKRQTVPLRSAAMGGPSCSNLTGISIDASARQYVWVKRYSNNIARIDRETFSHVTFTPSFKQKDKGARGNYVPDFRGGDFAAHGIVASDDPERVGFYLWGDRASWMAFVDGESTAAEKVNPELCRSGARIQAVAKDVKNPSALWIATFQGVTLYDTVGDVAMHYLNSEEEALLRGGFRFCTYRNGELCLADWRSICLYAPASGTVKRFEFPLLRKSSDRPALPEGTKYRIREMHPDPINAGTLWLVCAEPSDSHGIVCLLDTRTGEFAAHPLLRPETAPEGWQILSDSICLGMPFVLEAQSDGSLRLLHESRGTLTKLPRYAYPPPTETFCIDPVNPALIWRGQSQAGFLRYSLATSREEDLLWDPGLLASVSSPFFDTVSANHIWFDAGNDSLARISREKMSLESFPLCGISRGNTRMVFDEFDRGVLWILASTYTFSDDSQCPVFDEGCLLAFDRENERLCLVTPPVSCIRHMALSPEAMWFVTDAGLIRIDRQGE